jgi:hypothetical protein
VCGKAKGRSTFNTATREPPTLGEDTKQKSRGTYGESAGNDLGEHREEPGGWTRLDAEGNHRRVPCY